MRYGPRRWEEGEADSQIMMLVMAWLLLEEANPGQWLPLSKLYSGTVLLVTVGFLHLWSAVTSAVHRPAARIPPPLCARSGSETLFPHVVVNQTTISFLLTTSTLLSTTVSGLVAPLSIGLLLLFGAAEHKMIGSRMNIVRRRIRPIGKPSLGSHHNIRSW